MLGNSAFRLPPGTLRAAEFRPGPLSGSEKPKEINLKRLDETIQALTNLLGHWCRKQKEQRAQTRSLADCHTSISVEKSGTERLAKPYIELCEKKSG